MNNVARQADSGKTVVRRFHVSIPEAELAEMRKRIKATRWPERETVTDESQGVKLAMMQDLARYWATDYDWRKVESRLNALQQFITEIDGLFGNPEVGVGLLPGGGALEWLPRLVGRSRALEIVLSGDDFDADIAERYGWVNRTLDDANLDSFVDALVRRLTSFDRETLAAAKAQINRFGTPTAAEIQSSNDMFFSTLAQPGAQARRAKVRGIGYGVPSDFELNFGRYLPSLGRADHGDTGTQPDRSSP